MVEEGDGLLRHPQRISRAVAINISAAPLHKDGGIA
jgi:hypothetical protein